MKKLMNISPDYFSLLSSKTGFHRDILEKVYRICDLLIEINKHIYLKKMLVLKGGTALNFIYSFFPRLSVDIDFNFIGELDKERLIDARKFTENKLRDIFRFKKYVVEENSGYGMQTFYLRYINTFGNKDRINVEINYLYRLPLTKVDKKALNTPFGKSNMTIHVLRIEELLAGKILALVDRYTPRDLFDVYNLAKYRHVKVNKGLLRKLFVFYGCLARKDFREYSVKTIDNITEQDIKNDLIPLLKKNSSVSLNEMREIVIPYLRQVFKFDKLEKQYISSFFTAKFLPRLLFEKKYRIQNIEKHPMLLWKQRHIKEWRVKRKK